MANIIKAFNTAKDKKLVAGWDKNYIMVDIHATILKPSYREKETFEYYPYAKEVLKILSDSKEFSLILWTSSFRNKIDMYLDAFLKEGIHFDYVNVNTDEENTDIGCFDEKTYFDVGIDDKFGFEPETDWKEIFNYLKTLKKDE